MAWRAMLGQSGKCRAKGKKSMGRSKASLFPPSPKCPGLARGFPGLHRQLHQHLQPFPWTPPGSGPSRRPRAQSPFWLCPRHLRLHQTGTAHPTPLAQNFPFSFTFPRFSSAEKSHLTSNLRVFCS